MLMLLRSLPVLLVCWARSCLSFVIINKGWHSKSSPPLAATTSLKTGGGEGGWEWDGVVEEGAHDAEFGTDDDDDDEIFIPSAEFFSAANSVASPALVAATTTSGPFDMLSNSGIIHHLSKTSPVEGGVGDYVMSEDDLMEIGGDPAFLDDIVDGGDDDAWSNSPTANDDDFFWDGTVDEDAHND